MLDSLWKTHIRRLCLPGHFLATPNKYITYFKFKIKKHIVQKLLQETSSLRNASFDQNASLSHYRINFYLNNPPRRHSLYI